MNMSIFIIEDYLNGLSQFAECINISNKGITYLPDLSRFTNLKILYCSHNKLTSLSLLNPNLEELYCSYNKLTSLPKLNPNLKILCCHHNLLTILPPLTEKIEKLYCYNNKLTSLPPLNISLNELWCSYNQLTSLPSLNINLEELFCSYNSLTSFPNLNPKLKKCCCHLNPIYDIIYNSNMTILRYNIETLNRFKELFYCLKYKAKFRYLLWFKLREPKIQKKYHPTNLAILLNENNNIDLCKILNEW